MSGIDNRKQLMGFREARQRERCQTCAHRDMSGMVGPVYAMRGNLRCKLGAFDVSAYAVCDKWEARLA